MPLFYFHLRTQAGRSDDDTGLELIGIEAAYLEACRSIPAMSADMVHGREDPFRHSFEITDASGEILMVVPFAEVLDRGRKPVAPYSTLHRKAEAEMERTVRLIGSIYEEHAALRVTLAETRRLLALSRNVTRRLP